MLSIAVAVAGGVLGWQHWSDGTVFGPATSRNFGIVVGIEFGVAGLGAVILALRKHKEFIAPWVAFVVGVHLFPVAVVLQYPLIHVVGALVTIGSLLAVPLARSRSWAISFSTGLLTGPALLAGAGYSLVSALTQF